MEFSTEEFIEYVKHRPMIYDTGLPDYRINVRERDKSFDEIGQMMEVEPDVLKVKWKSLRDSYSKHLRTLTPGADPEARAIQKYRLWPWAQQMSFMRPFMQSKTKHSSLPRLSLPKSPTTDAEDVNVPRMPNGESKHETSDIVSTNGTTLEVSHSETPSLERIWQEVTEEKELPIETVIEYVDRPTCYNNTCDIDDVDLICLGYARTIKKLSPVLQAKVKFSISKVLMEAELEEQITSDASTFNPSLAEHSPSPHNKTCSPSTHGS